jgi:RHS repeat-associated protein
MRGGSRTRSNGQFVARSQKAAQNEIPTQDIPDTSTGKEATAGQGSSAIPSISLPKGGGAIRGIGEKFAANPVTGTGSLNVPISTTPGRSGFGPQLSLSYDSGSGNGPFGLGWSLSLPSITRKTDKGLPRYHDEIDSDVFILSGAEDLVPVFKKDKDENWIRDAQGNFIFDEEKRDGYVVRRYRPRIEGLFARIERWTNKTDGDIHWRSISKDNITTLYGKTDESRIGDLADTVDTKRVFSWLICESYDDKGNAIRYEYKAENSQGVDLSLVHERNRTAATRSNNRYLKHIKYGNKTPRLPNEDLSLRDDWMFEAVFDYGEHYTEDEQGQPTAVFINDDQRTWKVRQDPFSAHRAGFEVRTYRLCQRVLMFHHFKDELGTEDCLVRSTEFPYDESTLASFITKVTQSGYIRRTDGTYLKKSLPPLEFEYSQVTIQDEIEKIDAESLENLPIGLDGSLYQWVDLDGEGLSGILTEQADTWFYKPNQGGGDFGPLQVLAEKPSLADLSSGRQQLMDLAGDGQLDLVDLRGQVPGFYERTHDKHWKQFTPFVSLPNIDWNDPNLKFVDLTGDGHADILITEDQAFTWYLSLAEAGFNQGEKVRQALDENTGPRLVFADGTQSIYLADLSGDGLTDLVRIRNGEVCYWPNLGYGRFGAKVTMDNSPWFDHPDQFNQQRIRLADIDGSGTTDIIYLEHDGVHIYFNRSGNSWSQARTLRQFPHIDNLSAVMVADLKGNGTACIVWSSPLPGDAGRQMQFVDLMGEQKPHLLETVKNNMGAETRVHYAASTKFYLEDLKAGKPWITRIPFPVHVVERVETYDHISRNRFATRYAYHHGYFDGIEREFRGFGMVEQWDTEVIGTESLEISEGEETNWEEVSFVPPVLTRTWFHTGAYFERDLISKQFEDEYYREGDPSLGMGELDPEQLSAMLLDDTVLPEDLTVEAIREACRALKGGILRQEVFALDRLPDGRLSEESDRPYTVSERNYTIKQLQPRGDNKHAVFFVHPLETIDFHYERKLVDLGGKKLADPRVSHEMTLKVDDYGNIERSVAIGYPRRSVTDRQPEQKETHITLTVNRFINSPELSIKFPNRYFPEDPNWYRVGVPSETQTYEIVKPPEPAVTDTSVALFKFEDIRTLTEGLFGLDMDVDEPDPSKTLLYEKWNWRKAPPGETKLRLIEHARTLYRKDDLTGFLPLGQLDSLALPYESYKLALTPGLVTQVFDDKVTDATITNEAKYVHSEGDDNWWIPSGQVFYSPDKNDSPAQELTFAQQHFFLPHRFRDPFETVTTISYDNYDLLILESEDPLHNKVTAGERDEHGIITNKNDYRVLQPTLITDPNGAVSEALFDGLGMTVATAIYKGDIGDSLQGVQADLTSQQIDDFFANPGVKAVTRLGSATTRIIYDVDRYYLTGNPDRPPYAATIARETHVSDPVPEDGLKVQVSFSYSDGFGREIQKKIQAEPGPLEKFGPMVNPRWVGTGWTIFNNKGKPVRQYEPFFDDTYDFRYGKKVGVSPILFYDPVERVVATLHPNNTYEKVVFDPWHQETFDVNDTVRLDPKKDKDIQGYVARYFATQPATWKTWYEQRISGELGAEEQKAAQKSQAHADTPTVAYLDALGRTYLTVADNGAEGKYHTRVIYDIEGNQREVIDAKDRIVMQYDYDMLGNRIHQASMEAGERWMLNDVTGNPIRAWDSRGHNFWTEYDELRRPLRQFVKGTDDKNSDPRTLNTNVLFEKVEYGEDQENDIELNLRTRVFRQYDGAGIVTNMDRNPVTDKDEAYDFKGNLLRSTRKLAHDYCEIVNWSNAAQTDETFTNSTTYDALNRPIQMIAPHRTGTKFSVIQPVYNEANLLEREDVWLEKDIETEELLDPDTANHHAVKNIDYNEKGQRVLIQYGNGAETRYSYDPETFRLIHLYTRRDATFDEDCGDEPPRFPAPEKPPKGKQCGLQNIHYTYDPVGNIIVIRDYAQQTIYFNGEVVRPDADYTYDAVYRLIKAHGREHIGQASVPHTTWNDLSRVTLAHPHDGQKMRNYSEIYEYDEVDNFLKLKHYANSGDWVRTYDYNGENEKSLIETGKSSNRLSSTTVRGAMARYTYDKHGNMTRMPHFAKYDVPDQYNMYWDFEDQLQMVDKGNGCIAYYFYDAAGERVRKVIEQDGEKQKERIYFGGFEVYREYKGNSTITLERETLHIMDDKQRIMLIETRTLPTTPDPNDPIQLIRYQNGNHLGSASLELDSEAKIISYEEYYPYGSTSYQAVRSNSLGSIEVSTKRYRYTGKERDEETGLYYHGARYYASWLGRWNSCDPIGVEDSINLFEFTNSNPINFVDPSGMNNQRLGWTNDQQKYLREVAKMSKEEARRRGIPSNIHGYLKNERRRANKMARMIRKEGGVEAIRKKVDKIETTSKKIRTPFKNQFDVGHKEAHVMGGSNKPENLQFELARDNRKKGTRERIAKEKIEARKAKAGIAKAESAMEEIKPALSKAESALEEVKPALSKTKSALEKTKTIVSKTGNLLKKGAKVVGKVAGPLGTVLSAADLTKDIKKGDVSSGIGNAAGVAESVLIATGATSGAAVVGAFSLGYGAGTLIREDVLTEEQNMAIGGTINETIEQGLENVKDFYFGWLNDI